MRAHHRIVQLVRDLLTSASPASVLRHGQINQIAQDHIQSGFECLYRWRLCNLPEQPNEVFSCVQMGLFVFQFVSIAS